MSQGIVTTKKLELGQCFVCVYVKPDSEPMTLIMPVPLKPVIEAQIADQAKIAGSGGAPILGKTKTTKFTLMLNFPTVPFAVYASDEAMAAMAAREKTLADAVAQAKADAAEVPRNAAGGRAFGMKAEVGIFTATMQGIRKLPESPEVVPPPQAE